MTRFVSLSLADLERMGPFEITGPDPLIRTRLVAPSNLNSMHILELEYRIERDLRDIIQSHFPLDWKEDVLTHELAKSFRSHLRDTILYGTQYPLSIDWEIYKLHGTRETAHGDIGLLFRYKLPTGTVVEGAGFIEAKIRGRDTTKFLQVRHDQVTRILARSPQTRLLLYDYNAVTVLDSALDLDEDSGFLSHRHPRRGAPYARVTHGPVLPLQLAAAVNQYDDTLYRFAFSLSHQLTRRYFHLHDLDFTETAIKAVKGFPGELGSPNIIMVVRAAPRGQELPEDFRPNDNHFSVID